MKKQILAATALALVSGFAAASDDVTVYGTLDGGIASYKTPAGTVTGFNDSSVAPSLFGIRGSEDLGGGLKAIFNLEAGISIANGDSGNNSNIGGSFFNRMANVGLAGDFGTVKLGLTMNPLIQTFSGILPMTAESVYATAALDLGVANFFTPNSVTYAIPSIDGFNASAQYSFGGVAGDSNANNSTAVNASYVGGGFKLSGAYARREWNKGDFASANNGIGYPLASTPDAGSQTSYIVGLGYTVDAFTASVGYLHNDIGGFTTGGDAEVGAWMVGAAYQFTPAFQVGASYIDTNLDSKLASIQARYAFSKFTSVYALVDSAENGSQTGNSAALSNFGTIYVGGSVSPVTNATNQGFAVGLIHKF